MGAVSEAETLQLAEECRQREGGEEREVGEASLQHVGSTSFRKLEAEVLERLGGATVVVSSGTILVAPRREIAERDPSSGAVAHGRQLLEAAVGGLELSLGLVQALLLEERPTEHELRIADLVEVVDAVVEQRQRVPSLFLGLLDVARAQMNLGER